MFTLFRFFLIPVTVVLLANIGQAQPVLSSPDGNLQMSFTLNEAGKPQFSVTRNKEVVLLPSTLGIKTSGADLTQSLTIKKLSKPERVTDAYTTFNAKRSQVSYSANKLTVQLSNPAGQLLHIIFQLSNDGIAYRYQLPGKEKEPVDIIAETGTYIFPTSATAFLQPKAIAQTGWEHTNPSYEEHYLQDVRVGTVSPMAGWVYPALFKSGNNWALITETGIVGDYAATHLENDSGSNTYRISYPDPREVYTGKALIADATLPWQSPWRIIAIGSLQTIAESTLGTDLAPAPKKADWSWVQQGQASWSWINSKDDYIIASEQRKYIDFAADMHWKYCLVDADWDQKIGYDTIKVLADYAATKGVGLLLWYNSAGDWNTVKYTPKGKLLTHESRVKEFGRLKEIGIKGVKIDFFNGDGQSMMRYYNDIMADAAENHLMVNFHGATLPRGWARTWPNLMTMESVRGFEMVTFGQRDADLEPAHGAMLPFTRNAFDPMDFTPMNLYKLQTRVQRKTSSAYELATSILFLSGIQHMAESPEGMSHVPAAVKDLLRQLPAHWDETRFLDGYPGKLVVMARRSGNRWYIAGINGENKAKKVSLNLDWLKQKNGTLITDGQPPLIFGTQSIAVKGVTQINIQPNGGFVMLF